MSDVAGLGDHVSRETTQKLAAYQSSLLRWTKTINLISPSTADAAWERHIVDSAQVFDLIPKHCRQLVDIGSGGGLPGLVIAIMAQEHKQDLTVTLIESDQRKVAFLRTIARELSLSARIICNRIEAVENISADVLTARALAPLPDLLGYAQSILAPRGIALFQKGRNVAQEVESARMSWQFALTSHPSRTDKEGCILQIEDIRRAET